MQQNATGFTASPPISCRRCFWYASPLTQVAEFDHRATGVAVTADGRRFVNFPRWTDDAPVSVAEVLKDGSLEPYPDAK